MQGRIQPCGLFLRQQAGPLDAVAHLAARAAGTCRCGNCRCGRNWASGPRPAPRPCSSGWSAATAKRGPAVLEPDREGPRRCSVRQATASLAVFGSWPIIINAPESRIAPMSSYQVRPAVASRRRPGGRGPRQFLPCRLRRRRAGRVARACRSSSGAPSGATPSSSASRWCRWRSTATGSSASSAMTVRAIPKSKPTTGEIWALYVEPSHWGRGAGLALVGRRARRPARGGLHRSHACGCRCATSGPCGSSNWPASSANSSSAKTAMVGGVKLEEIRLRRPLD